MAKQTFTTGQVLTAAQMTSLQQTAMGGGSATAKTASYVLVAADAGTTVAMNAAGATTITVNTALFAAGDTVFIQNLGAGACTVTAGTATVATAGSLILPQNDAGILYFTATGAAIFYDYIQAGAVSPLTTKGDLYTFSTSDARLAVGSNGTTLVADSSEATGLKWQAASAGAGNLAQIATGSTTSGSSFTISGLSSYTEIIIFLYSVRIITASRQLTLRLNSNSGANYDMVGNILNLTTPTIENFLTVSDSAFVLTNTNMTSNQAQTAWAIKLTNCKNAGFTDLDFTSNYDGQQGFNNKGVYKVSEAISSLTIAVGSPATWDNGSYVVWGA